MISETEIVTDQRDVMSWRRFRRNLATGKKVKDWKFCWFILLMLRRKGYIKHQKSDL